MYVSKMYVSKMYVSKMYVSKLFTTLVCTFWKLKKKQLEQTELVSLYWDAHFYCKLTGSATKPVRLFLKS